jgi:hypothetical protein
VDKGHVIGLSFSLKLLERNKIGWIACSDAPAHLVGPGCQKVKEHAFLPISSSFALSSASIFDERVLLSAS